MDNVIDLGERVCSLDAILHQIPVTGMDANLILSRMNEIYDQVGVALEINNFKGQEDALDGIMAEAIEVMKNVLIPKVRSATFSA